MINYIDVKNIGFKKVQGNPIHHEVWVGCKAQKHLVNQIKSSIFALSV